MSKFLNRRGFLRFAAATGAAATARLPACAAPPDAGQVKNPICAFIKYLQLLDYEQLADAVAQVGFNGIEATVRQGGYIEPAAAPDELPKLAEALRSRGLNITMITTDVLCIGDRETRSVLQTAADLGIPMYRLGFYRYDLSKPVLHQLEEVRPQLAELAAFNGELGLQGLYQNHSGADIVGATVWDIYDQIKDLPPQQIDLAFDIRHATIEAGLAWPAVYNAVKSRVAAIYVKDFDWKGRRVEHVPLGTGRVDRRFFQTLHRDRFAGPISVHVEYQRNEGADANLAALRRDLATLEQWLAS